MFNCRLWGVYWQRIKATNDLPIFYFVAHPKKYNYYNDKTIQLEISPDHTDKHGGYESILLSSLY